MNIASVFHDADRNYKFTHPDGRESIYIRKNGEAIKLNDTVNSYVNLVGPIFNYTSKSQSTDDSIINNVYLHGHFYFDMLTYYYWGSVHGG